MPQYNDMFELSVEDMDLIETALRSVTASLSKGEAEEFGENKEETLRDIQDLLGRLHNQKIFYRPKDIAHISG